MTWWSSANKHPKMKSRFIVEFGNGGRLSSVKSCTKPAVSIESKQYQMINHMYSYPGIAVWEPIQIKFVDAGIWGADGTVDLGGKPLEGVTPPNKKWTSQALWEMLLSSGYTPPTLIESGGIKKLPTGRVSSISSPEKAATMDVSFGKSLMIHQILPSGLNSETETVNTSETWVLYNPTIVKISWGELDYGDDGLVEYTLEVRYDFAEHNTVNPNLRAQIAEDAARIQEGLAGLASATKPEKDDPSIPKRQKDIEVVSSFIGGIDFPDDSGDGSALQGLDPNEGKMGSPIPGSGVGSGGLGNSASSLGGGGTSDGLGIDSVVNLGEDYGRPAPMKKPDGPPISFDD